jgi:hypothetical protein
MLYEEIRRYFSFDVIGFILFLSQYVYAYQHGDGVNLSLPVTSLKRSLEKPKPTTRMCQRYGVFSPLACLVCISYQTQGVVGAPKVSYGRDYLEARPTPTQRRQSLASGSISC